MTLTTDNIEDITTGRALAEITDLLNEANSDPAHVEYYPEVDQLFLYNPKSVGESTIKSTLERMVQAGMLTEINVRDYGGFERVRLLDTRNSVHREEQKHA